jgi:hypothetical protein
MKQFSLRLDAQESDARERAHAWRSTPGAKRSRVDHHFKV